MQIVVQGTLAEVIAPLTNLPEKAQRAMREGLQQGGDKVRTQVRHALKVQTGVKAYGTIVKHTTGTLSHSGILNYVIRGDGKGLPIANFPVKAKDGGAWRRWDRREHYVFQTRDHGRFGKAADAAPEVSAAPWSVMRLFQRSFVHPTKGLMAAYRTGATRIARRPLYGASISKEIVRGGTVEVFHRSVRVDVLPPIEKRLRRALG